MGSTKKGLAARTSQVTLIYTLPEIIMDVKNCRGNSHPRGHAIHFHDDSRECCSSCAFLLGKGTQGSMTHLSLLVALNTVLFKIV